MFTPLNLRVGRHMGGGMVGGGGGGGGGKGRRSRNLQANHQIIVIIMEICKAPTPRHKALNKHSIAHIMYIEMENVTSNLTKTSI